MMSRKRFIYRLSFFSRSIHPAFDTSKSRNFKFRTAIHENLHRSLVTTTRKAEFEEKVPVEMNESKLVLNYITASTSSLAAKKEKFSTWVLFEALVAIQERRVNQTAGIKIPLLILHARLDTESFLQKSMSIVGKLFPHVFIAPELLLMIYVCVKHLSATQTQKIVEM